MTKIWKKMSFWNKIKGTIALAGVGSEVTLFVVDSNHKWKVVAAAATIISFVITIWFEDKNGDDIVDMFQGKKNKPSA